MEKYKKCKGINKAKSFDGCGTMVLSKTRRYGLCIKCFAKFMTETKEGGEVLRKMVIPRAKKKAEREIKQIHKENKLEVKKKSKLESELQTLINELVRKIDEFEGCISCDHGNNEPFTMQAHASHYYSRGSSPHIRFNLHNIHKSCSRCNNYEHSNREGYDLGLEKKYGIRYLYYIKSLKEQPSLDLTKSDIQALKTKVRRSIKNFDKEIKPEMTLLEIRDKYNKELFGYEKYIKNNSHEAYM